MARWLLPRVRWSTISMTTSPQSRQRASAAAARPARRAATARPTSLLGPSRMISPAACPATSSGVISGAPRWPAWCAALTSRHSDAQPRLPSASSVTRAASSLCSRAGADGFSTRTGSRWDGPASARSAPRIGAMPASAHATACFTAPYRPSRSVSASARMPCSAARVTRAAGAATPYRSE